MNNAWTVEFSRILVVLAVVLLFGVSTGYWVLAVLIPSAIYIGWTLVQIRVFERWIRLGAKTKLAPDSSGIWQLIVQHIYRIQKKDKERKKRLTDMAARFEATISALPETTIVLNSHLEIEWMNTAAEDAFGIESAKDLGQRLDNLIRLPQLSALLESASADETKNLPAIEINSPIDVRKTLIIKVTRFGNQQILVTARDISQRIAVQKMRKTFIANASHELRTPLTVIAGYLEILESDDSFDSVVKQQIGNASQQATRMTKILDDLLILSKLEEKGHEADEGDPINMELMIKTLVIDFEKTKAKGTHQFKLTLQSDLQLKAIETEIYSLLQNLISNAVKYSPTGSTIQIDWQKDSQGWLLLKVKDNGEGIAPEHISRLTERFYRVNVTRSRQVGGTGLGLSIVKHILENHDGHLKIKSELGRGSEFIACFPPFRKVE